MTISLIWRRYFVCHRDSNSDIILHWLPRALSYYSDLTLSQSFQPMAAQLSKKAALPLGKMIATASCRISKTGPWYLFPLINVNFISGVIYRSLPHTGFKSYILLKMKFCSKCVTKCVHLTYIEGEMSSRGTPFTNIELTIIPTWISIHKHSKVWDEMTYPFPDFTGCTVEVRESISYFIPQLSNVCSYLSMLWFKFNCVNKGAYRT